MKKLFILLITIITMMMSLSSDTYSETNSVEEFSLSTNLETNILIDSDRFLMFTEEIIKAIDEERIIIEEQIKTKQEEIDNINKSNIRKNNVSFNSDDVTEISGISAVDLYNVLINFNDGLLADYAWTFVECEELYDINAFFIAALVAHESGWGSSDRTNYQNNLTGYAVYSDSSVGTTFSSKEECIYKTSELLRNEYLNSKGLYYKGVSVRAVNTRYCLFQDRKTTDYNWSVDIINIANNFNEYYHNNIKRIKDVPIMDIDMEKLLDDRRREILSQIKPNEHTFLINTY